ncbi:MAG TPA: uroporphyrinogen decarboxylase family protein [Methanomassiliicoccales archaeon]|nr:uroporphyrinogen decarboxylase family protein [Methanomassiliicoccales archaeon]
MTPKERFSGALAREPVDHVPLFYQHLGAAKWILQHTGLTIKEGFHDPAVFAKLAMASHDLYQFDNVMAGWGDLLIEAQAHGMEWRFPERDFYPRAMNYVDLAKVDGIHPVDPMKDKYWSVPLKAASIMNEKIGDKVKILGCLDSPLLAASETIGMETLMMGEFTAPDQVKHLVRTITSSSIAYVEHLNASGIDTVFIDNSSASMELNSEECCEDFDHRFLRELMRRMDALGMKAILHNDAVHPYLAKQLDLRPAGLHFHLMNVDMPKTFEMLKGSTCVFAGIDHTDLLFQKTPQDIEAEVMRIMRAWGDAPGLIMAPGCEMAYKTPMENIRTLRESTVGFKN